mgnify:CR=1 FL=1
MTSVRAKTARAAWEAYQAPAFKKLASEVNPTTLRNLLAASGEAEILEELFILLEYQVGRKVLPAEFRDHLRDAINAQIKANAAAGDDAQRLEVARSYLTHVTRLHRAIAK